HAIIAVKIPDAIKAPAAGAHPRLGRLLFFDPTDEDTPVGYLPEHEQESLALIVAGESGDLMKMPAAPPAMNRLEREADAALAPDGSIQAKWRERSFGQAAIDNRKLFRRRGRPEYVKTIERWITRGASGAAISKIEPKEGAEGEFALEVEFAA